MTTIPRPPYDTELEAALAVVLQQFASAHGTEPGAKASTTLAEDLIQTRRSGMASPPIDPILQQYGLAHTEHVVPGPEGDPDITLSVFKRHDLPPGAPCVYNIHGGGMVIGDRFTGMDRMLAEWAVDLGAVVVSVEYRLAPENPDPAPVEDCYAGLLWTAAHARELGADPERILVAGASAGGGLAAGVALLARDRGGPRLIGQLLICPMLDDRNETLSSHQYDGIGVWDRGSNETGWTALLGDRRGTGKVSIYAAPARATDLSNLPPAFIDVGSAEVFRDEDVAYAMGIWAAGGVADLHVWAGGFHGFSGMAPHAAVSAAANETRTNWTRRILGT
ncbi:alpha/beta hydrolase [Sphaerisporangium album]|uniref:Alpha/beta hydrolase n=1 Tax=Sphaerisporangium album TaxID=509200 RepID=A0A367FD54_9ACTN|nr:alpha/beta hydrolase [Sphaerisporangium album]RCG28298.1 alpha/beta hydrolase [Sphaerisporangium album]